MKTYDGIVKKNGFFYQKTLSFINSYYEDDKLTVQHRKLLAHPIQTI